MALHGRVLDDGYDCSGSVSFALYAAELIEGSRPRATRPACRSVSGLPIFTPSPNLAQ